MKISVIIPVFNESRNLPILNKDLKAVLDNLLIDYEIIYVDDGSCDGSAIVLKKIWEKNRNIKIISLLSNFGQTQAIAAGLDNSEGEIIVTMDADLQHDSADIPKLLNKLEEGYDLVTGWRLRRCDPLFAKRMPSFLANKIISYLAKVNVHDFGCNLRAYKREILEKIDFYGEIHRFLPLCLAVEGAKIGEVRVGHNFRRYGCSKYGIARIFKTTLDILILLFFWKFATKPIYFFGGMGMLSLGFSFLIALFIIARKFFFSGLWVSPLLFIFVIFFIMGIQFIVIGVLAELMVRLYYSSRGQKRYKIKQILTHSN